LIIIQQYSQPYLAPFDAISDAPAQKGIQLNKLIRTCEAGGRWLFQARDKIYQKPGSDIWAGSWPNK